MKKLFLLSLLFFGVLFTTSCSLTGDKYVEVTDQTQKEALYALANEANLQLGENGSLKVKLTGKPVSFGLAQINLNGTVELSNLGSVNETIQAELYKMSGEEDVLVVTGIYENKIATYTTYKYEVLGQEILTDKTGSIDFDVTKYVELFSNSSANFFDTLKINETQLAKVSYIEDEQGSTNVKFDLNDELVTEFAEKLKTVEITSASIAIEIDANKKIIELSLITVVDLNGVELNVTLKITNE